MSTPSSPDLKLLLTDFGLSEPEILVYLACVELGSRSAGAISKRAKLKRGHTYNILTLLLQKGLLQEFIKGGIKNFAAGPPSSFISILEDRESDLIDLKRRMEDIAPHLEKLRNPNLTQPKVRFYPGVEGVKEIFEDTIRVRDQPIYTVSEASVELTEQGRDLARFIKRYIPRRIERNCWYYGIVNDSRGINRALESGKQYKRAVKRISGIPLDVEFMIYGSKLAIACLHDQMFGFVIQDKIITDTARRLHQAVWESLPNYTNSMMAKLKQLDRKPKKTKKSKSSR